MSHEGRPGFFRLLLRDRGACLGLALVLLVVGMAACAGFAPWGPREMDWEITEPVPPNADHILGTDGAGYDVFSRLLYGARISLLTGVAAIGLALLVGVPLGAISGYAGGWVDGVLMRVVDVMLAFPSVILAIAIAAWLDARTIGTLIVAVAVVNVPTVARQVRGSVLQVKGLEYVTAARALGMHPARILVRQVLPNCLAPILVLATLGVGHAILSAAGLSFLGLGPEARVAEWGVMLKDGVRYVTSREQWVVIPPGAAIAITVLGFNLVGDGLRRALDPRSR